VKLRMIEKSIPGACPVCGSNTVSHRSDGTSDCRASFSASAAPLLIQAAVDRPSPRNLPELVPWARTREPPGDLLERDLRRVIPSGHDLQSALPPMRFESEWTPIVGIEMGSRKLEGAGASSRAIEGPSPLPHDAPNTVRSEGSADYPRAGPFPRLASGTPRVKSKVVQGLREVGQGHVRQTDSLAVLDHGRAGSGKRKKSRVQEHNWFSVF
jgi:hypothetical protein